MRKLLNRQFVEFMVMKLDDQIEAYKMAFNLQYGSPIKLVVYKKKDRYFDCWIILISRKDYKQRIATIETNISGHVFDIRINMSVVSFSKEFNQFNYEIIDKSQLDSFPYIEILTDDPSQLIDILVLCEKHISFLESAQ